MMPFTIPYNGSITREQWLINETRLVSRLRLDDGMDDDAIVELVRQQNLFQYPTEREILSKVRCCLRRLDALSDDPTLREQLTQLIAHGALEQRHQTNLYAMMRAYRLVGEFMVLVVGNCYRTRDLQLGKKEIRIFLNNLACQDERVAKWTDATITKICQVLNSCLASAGLKDSARSNQLVPVYLDGKLAELMAKNGDQDVLPAFNRFWAVD